MRKNINVKTMKAKFSYSKITTTTKAVTSNTILLTTNESMLIQFTEQEIRVARQLEVSHSRANSLLWSVLASSVGLQKTSSPSLDSTLKPVSYLPLYGFRYF